MWSFFTAAIENKYIYKLECLTGITQVMKGASSLGREVLVLAATWFFITNAFFLKAGKQQKVKVV